MAEFRKDWIAKTVAGLLPGFGIAVAAAGAFAWFGPGGAQALNKYQVVMWMVPPVWLAVLGSVYLFRDGLRAWLWLGSLCLMANAGVMAGRDLLLR